MKRLKPLGFLLVALVACSDGIGPPQDLDDQRETRTDGELHMLRHARQVRAVDPGPYGVLFEPTDAPKPLKTYVGQFWAVFGEERSLEIDYDDGSQFLRIIVGNESLLAYPDGTLFALGDSVQISVSVDNSLFLIALEPSGLTFATDQPLDLLLRYADADPDYNGDGVVDAADSDLRLQLGVWGQPGAGNPWQIQAADHDVDQRWLHGYLKHFSNYTVSW